MLEALSRTVAYPLWDLKDRSDRPAQYRSLLESQWQSPSEIEKLRLRRLNDILAHAYDRSAFYRSHWGQPRQVASTSAVASIPLVTKQMLRDNLDRIVVRRAGAVSVHVRDLVGRDARVGERAADRKRSARPRRVGRRHVVRVGAHAEAGDLREDRCPATARALHCARPSQTDPSIPQCVEPRPASL